MDAIRNLWNRLREVILAGAFVGAMAGTSANVEDWELHIVFFDVGQADAIGMVASNGDAVVIDAGHGRTAAAKIARFLHDEDANGFASIDVAKLGIVTHYDSDHMGGFTALGDEGITFKSVYDQGPSVKRSGKALYTKYLRAVHDTTDDMIANEDGHLRKVAKVGLHWKLGDANLKVVSARGDTKGSQFDIALDPCAASIDENPGSVAVLLELGDFRLYTAGDQTSDDWKVEPDTEISVLLSGVLGGNSDVDIYKGNHHGSDTSNGHDFLQGLSPEVSVVSSKLTGHGLPKRIAVKQMIEAGSLVFVTGDGRDEFDVFTDSGATAEDDDYEPPAESIRNASGDVHVLVNKDGTRYVVFTDQQWRAFSADENGPDV